MSCCTDRWRSDRSASDLFSLGATLFTVVEGKPPFDKGGLSATLTAVTEDAPAPFRRAGPLRPVIEGLLAKEPHRRLNADQAHAALRAIRRGRPTPMTGHRPQWTMEFR
jgi:serine/threonine protein kinase